jgi:hypothetical protein
MEGPFHASALSAFMAVDGDSPLDMEMRGCLALARSERVVVVVT